MNHIPRPFKDYKPGDVIEPTEAEQSIIAGILTFQEYFIKPYMEALSILGEGHPICIVYKAKAQEIVATCWRMFQQLFPGLNDSESFAQYESDVGGLNRFILCTKEQAFEHFRDGQIKGRVLTVEWERDYAEWIKAHPYSHSANESEQGKDLSP